jgi:integrase
MDHSSIIQRFEEELSNSSPLVTKSRVAYARKFLDFTGAKPFSEWDGRLVTSFTQHLKAEGYSEGTVRQVFSIVKRVFDAARNAHETERVQLISSVDPTDPSAVAQLIKAISMPAPNWNLGKRAAPKVTQRNTPTMTMEDLTVMVHAAQNDGFEPHEKACLALASIYPLRRGELRRIKPEDIDYDRHTIFVHTQKGGDQRDQLLADDLLPILRQCDFSRQFSDFDMSRMWWSIEQKAGLNHQADGGWHSLRRLVVTTLKDVWGDDALQVKIFGHWRLASSPEISDRYYHKDPLETDRAVLAKHPIVPLWRGAMRMDLGK